MYFHFFNERNPNFPRKWYEPVYQLGEYFVDDQNPQNYYVESDQMYYQIDRSKEEAPQLIEKNVVYMINF